MPRCYTVTLTPTAIAVATTDLIALRAATDIPIKIRSLRVWQTSDFGDAQDEIVTLQLVRGNTTAGSAGATFTPVPADKKDAAASLTARVGDTTAASAGTTDIPYQSGWNVRAPFEFIFPDEMMVRGDQGGGFIVLRFGAAPVDSLTVAASISVWEI
ncbi:MAG TPA: hypothetical protein VLN57_21260 [Xanthobacteraceae bacterium]|nr:hypothetical protein [Xanthobacteraceae bacterium]